MDGIVPHFLIEGFVLDDIVVALPRLVLKQIVEMPTQRPVTQFIYYPRVELLDFVVVHDEDVVDSRVGLELLPGSPILEEVVAEPNLLQVGLILVVGEDLLHRVGFFRLLVEPHPHQGEPSPSE